MTTDLVERAIAAARAATEPEAVVHDAMAILFATLGDRSVHLVSGSLEPGQHQFFVCGAFFVTPDKKHQMLVGNTGFPPDQRRLLIPIDGGHPGRVIVSVEPLLLEDTRQHASFKQYLKTSRMGSAVYAPMIWDSAAKGLLIMAAQAGGTMRKSDLACLVEVADAVRDCWLATGGPAWLAAEYELIVG